MALETLIVSLPESNPDGSMDSAPSSGQNTINSTPCTTSGFLVGGTRLRDFTPTPPTKWPKRSWIWRHGEPLYHVKEREKGWLCRICFDRTNDDDPIFWCRIEPTNQALRHLETHGFDEDGTRKATKRKAEYGDIVAMMKKQKQAQEEVFDHKRWIGTYVEWLVSTNQSLRQATHSKLRELAAFRNPIVRPVYPDSHNTARTYVTDTFTASKDLVVRDLQAARSTITISFDNWLADNELDLLGIMAHYLDKHLKLKSVLLGLRPSYSHTGENIAESLLGVLREYQVSDKVGYFVADNAKNNDAALRTLAKDLSIDPITQRLRCSGHIINLVANAILYGTDTDCVLDADLMQSDHQDDGELQDSATVTAFAAALCNQDPAARLAAWRSKGPVGKLHNIVVHVKSGAARRRYFENKQRELDTTIYRVVIDGGIRWNSACDMIERALKVKDALQLYQEHFRDEVADRLDSRDCLSAEDWQELTELLQLLKPLQQMSLRVQASGKDGVNGALWQSLAVLEWLLSKLENLKKSQALPNQHFRACINLGWKKLNKYYDLSDRKRQHIILPSSFIQVSRCGGLKFTGATIRAGSRMWRPK